MGEQVAELLSHLVQVLKLFAAPAHVPAAHALQVPLEDPEYPATLIEMEEQGINFVARKRRTTFKIYQLDTAPVVWEQVAELTAQAVQAPLDEPAVANVPGEQAVQLPADD